MANSYNTADLIKGTLQKCGENTDGSSPYHELALKYINDVYHAVLSGSNEFIEDTGHSWRWAISSASFILNGFYSSDTISLTNGSINGSFSVAPVQSQAGRFLKITDRPTYYEIDSHIAGATAFTLKTVYIEDTGAGLSYKSIPLRYDLVFASGLTRGILRLMEPMRIYADRELEFLETESDQGRMYGLAMSSFRKEFPLRDLENKIPTTFATDTRTDSEWFIIINNYPSEDMKVDFDYIEIKEDLVDDTSSIPVLPREFRVALECGAAHYVLIDKEEKEKAAYYFQMAQKKLQSLHKADDGVDQATSRTYGKLIPRMDDNLFQRWITGQR